MLAPFSLGRVGLSDILGAFRGMPGLAAIAGGAIAAFVCGQGVTLLAARPEVTVGLLLGTLVGVALLRGVPVGPLAAAGVTALILNLFGGGRR